MLKRGGPGAREVDKAWAGNNSTRIKLRISQALVLSHAKKCEHELQQNSRKHVFNVSMRSLTVKRNDPMIFFYW